MKILVAAAIGVCVLVAAPAALAMTWAGPETSPTTSTLYGVSCPDASHCFAVGGTTSAGTIIHTANAGGDQPHVEHADAAERRYRAVQRDQLRGRQRLRRGGKHVRAGLR